MNMNSTLRSNVFASLTVASLIAASVVLTACSSGDVAVGSTSQELQKKKDGTPTGNGATCSWDDTVSSEVASGGTTTTPAPNGTYNLGDTFKSPDGCNDCSCSAQGILCTLRACAPAPGGGTCSYNGKTYATGASFPSSDNCNNCGCQADGNIICTERACAPAPTPTDCKKTGCSGEICSDQDVASACLWTAAFACYQTATCERQAGGACGFTASAALTQCLATAK